MRASGAPEGATVASVMAFARGSCAASASLKPALELRARIGQRVGLLEPGAHVVLPKVGDVHGKQEGTLALALGEQLRELFLLLGLHAVGVVGVGKFPLAHFGGESLQRVHRDFRHIRVALGELGLELVEYS